MLPKNVVRLSGDEVTSLIYCSTQPCLVSCQSLAYLLQVCAVAECAELVTSHSDWQDTRGLVGEPRSNPRLSRGQPCRSALSPDRSARRPLQVSRCSCWGSNIHHPGASRWKAHVDLGDQAAEFMPFKVIRTATLTYFYPF